MQEKGKRKRKPNQVKEMIKKKKSKLTLNITMDRRLFIERVEKSFKYD